MNNLKNALKNENKLYRTINLLKWLKYVKLCLMKLNV